MQPQTAQSPTWQHLDAHGKPLVEGAHYFTYTEQGRVPGVIVWDARYGFMLHPDNGSKPFSVPCIYRSHLVLYYNGLERG